MGYMRLLQLRRLAADGVGGAGGGQVTTDSESTDPGGEGQPGTDDDVGKSFTQEDVNRIVSERLLREKARLEKEHAEKIVQARTEAEKLAKMSADERAQAEKDAAERKLQEREANITRRELRAQALETLAEKKLPAALIDCIALTDADACNKSIDAVDKAYREAVTAGVNAELRSNPPKVNKAPGATAPTTLGEAVQAHYEALIQE